MSAVHVVLSAGRLGPDPHQGKLMSRTEFELTLSSVAPLTPTVRYFTFDEPTVGFAFEPGQFLMLHFEIDGATWQRSYSLASRRPEGEPPGIAVAPVEGGRATRYLWRLQPGDRVRASGPYGRFCLRADEAPPHLVLVATGTGIAPYRTMIPLVEARARAGLRTTVALGDRTHVDLLFAADFRSRVAASDGFEFRAYLSREDPVAGDERRGYVTGVFDELDIAPDRGDLVYLCGNPQMVDDGVERLKRMGFSPRNIRREKYI